MVKHLFPTFLQDEAQYRQTEAYWHGLWDDVLSGTGKDGEWETPWLNTVCLNGTVLRDGDPIFSTWDPRRKLAVRIVQYAPQSDDVDLTCSIARFDEEVQDLRVLEIFCALSEEAAQQAEELLGRFVRTGQIGW